LFVESGHAGEPFERDAAGVAALGTPVDVV
jgi:hypothetical protein